MSMELTKAASRVRLCLPLPPTPTSRAFPWGDSRMRLMWQLREKQRHRASIRFPSVRSRWNGPGGPGTLAGTSWAELGKTQLRGRLRKDAQGESCKLSFILGNMRTAALEIAPCRVPRNCFREIRGEDSTYMILERESTSNQAHIVL